MSSTLVYSTDGSTRSTFSPEVEALFDSAPVEEYWADQDWCGVCHRATDHFGEHDDMLSAGLAEVDEDGYLVRTARWDDDVARLISDAGFKEYMKGEHAYRGFLAGLLLAR